MEAVGRPRFGALLRRYRIDAGLTQQGLAERSSLSVEAIGLLERECRTRPQRETVTLLLGALNLSPEDESLLRSALDVAHPPRRRDVPSKRPALSVSRPDDSAAGRHNIPQQRTSFVGRKQEFDELAGLLEKNRVVTVVGSGGVGKTRLSLRVAESAVERFPDGVWLVDLAPISGDGLVAGAVLAALQLHGTSGDELDAVVGYLRARRLLLILDSCEHVLARARDVAARIVASCPQVYILSTSRENLNLEGGQVYRLKSLAVPPDEGCGARESLSYHTVELFVDRAKSVDSTFRLTEDNARHVAEICRRLDGIPLAIELAAARTAMLAPRQIADRLDRRFRLLTGGNPRALRRHQTMSALIDWSYDLLSPREQHCFECLSVFAGGCTLDVATAVCAAGDEDDLDVFDMIASLVTKSLLVTELVGDEQRYRLLESLRQYARAKLISRGEQERVARRHALAYLEVAQRLERATNAMTERKWTAQAKLEIENLRAALEWTLGERRDVALGQRLVAERKIILRGFTPIEAQRWVQAALKSIDGGTSPDVIARLELANADAQQFGGRKLALAAGERALAGYCQIGDAAGIAQSQRVVGSALVLLGRAAEAEPILRESLATARSLGDQRLAARLLMALGWARSFSGDFAGARAHLGNALRLATVSGAEFLAVAASASLAENEFEAGDAQTALRLSGAVLAELRSLHSPTMMPGMAATLANMSTYLIAVGRYEAARANGCKALELAGSLGLASLASLALRLVALATLLDPRNEGQRLAEMYAGAARIFGFLTARLGPLAPERYALDKEYDRALTTLRDAFAPNELIDLLAAGAVMTDDEAVNQAYALL